MSSKSTMQDFHLDLLRATGVEQYTYDRLSVGHPCNEFELLLREGGIIQKYTWDFIFTSTRGHDFTRGQELALEIFRQSFGVFR